MTLLHLRSRCILLLCFGNRKLLPTSADMHKQCHVSPMLLSAGLRDRWTGWAEWDGWVPSVEAPVTVGSMALRRIQVPLLHRAASAEKYFRRPRMEKDVLGATRNFDCVHLRSVDLGELISCSDQPCNCRSCSASPCRYWPRISKF
ncbi:hypothetical protein C7974DRAFT_229431 [Boeremia exigua]|uniref:uncharacterized protein n=1 Tax=Boeremia exigua TaxID=749465 RepID=UPI001E8DFE3E|nr:uncharacterized protein C7974DRAFT_229431 [Boeremia exigua]KAH6620251.1 hypothetical protein C7974DRAFT_229431 [Boeremia exigua]